MLNLISSIFLVFAALFEFVDRFQDEDERQKTRLFYSRVLETLTGTNFKHLPTKAFDSIINVFNATSTKILHVFAIIQQKDWIWLFQIIILIGISIMAYLQERYITSIILFIALIGVIGWNYEKIINRDNKWGDFLYKILFLPTIISLFLSPVIIGLVYQILIEYNATLVILIPILLLPTFISILHAYSSVIPIIVLNIDPASGSRASEVEPISNKVSALIIISFMITSLAILTGLLLDKSSVVPNAIQLVIVNLIFDAITILFTIHLMKLTILRGGFSFLYTIPVDIAIAIICGLFSVYLGTVFSTHSISVGNVFNLSFIYSKSGNEYSFGILFWLAITAIIPSLIYIVIIISSLISKSFLEIVSIFIKRTSIIDKPHHLMAGLMLFLGAISNIVIELIKII